MGSILLNGREVTPQSLEQLHPEIFDGIESEVLLEISIFLKEWWNDADHITVQTSGSTGTPKEIQLSKKTVAASADKTISFFGLNSEQRVLLCLPCKYIAGKLMLVRAIRAKLNLVLVNPDLNPLEQLQQDVDFAAMIPSQVMNALNQSETKKRLAKIPQVLIGGAPIDPSLEKDLAKMSNRFFHSYGMTETATHVALREIGESEMYQALEGVRFSTDERDCLVIEADHLEEPISTNDLVELEDDQRFKWLGRADNAIISGGVKHIPELLEKKIAVHIPAPFIISGIQDRELGQKLILTIEGEPWTEDRVQSLRDKLSITLQRYETPKEILFQEKFERTATGKIKRSGN